MKFYISGPPHDGEGVYDLLTEEGEHLASHYCSSKSFARGDLEARREERQKEWHEKYGDYEVVYLGDDSMTREELIRLNHEFHSKELEGETHE